ncbi:MAG: hypothetical protein JWN86_1742 [Planctomycetota bacterium]|nr:hypothetical protein [Planctomycetota bacterium]
MSRRVGLALGSVVFMTLVGLTGEARAQGIVPGGWSQQFQYHSLGSVSVAPVVSDPWSTGWGGSSVAYSPYGLYQGSVQPMPGFSGYVSPPRTVNTLVPLGDVIRRNTHSRRSR